MDFPNIEEENRLISEGYRIVAGVDEVGRGPLAGPVLAAAVIMPISSDYSQIEGVKDSKKLSEKQKDVLYDKILNNCICYGIGIVDSDKIDEINIYEATKLAMNEAVKNLTQKPDFLLIDAMKLEVEIPQKSIIKGDARCYSIACASIIAKVARDKMMQEYHNKFPDYGFDKHKGYGTRLHLESLKKIGPCKIHRKSYKPVKIFS